MALKSQMFLISAFIIASFLLAGKIALRSQKTSLEISMLQLSLKGEEIENVLKELKNAARFSPEADIITNVVDFSNFSCYRLENMGNECKIMNALALADGNLLNVSVVNFWDEDYEFELTLWNATHSQTKKMKVADRSSNHTTFNIAPGLKYNLSVAFNDNNQTFEIKTKNNRKAFNALYLVLISYENGVSKKVLQDYFLIR